MNTEPMTHAWTILRPLKIGPDPAAEFVPPLDPLLLRSERISHEAHEIVRAITIFMDKHNLARKGAQSLESALHSIAAWKSEAKPKSKLIFAFRQWRLNNWVIDVQDAQKIWEDEVRQLEICAHALRTAQRGLSQLPGAQQQSLTLTFDVLLLQLHNRIEFDRKCLHNSQKLVLLRQQIMAQESSLHALEVLKQWEAEN